MSNFLELGMLRVSLDAEVRLEWSGTAQEYIVFPQFYEEMEQNYIRDYVGSSIRDVGTVWSQAGGMEFDEDNLGAYIYWNNQPVPTLHSSVSAMWDRFADLLNHPNGMTCIQYADVVIFTHNNETLTIKGYELIQKLEER